MENLVFISDNVVKKLEAVLQDKEASGFLVGWKSENSVYISGCIAVLKENDSKPSINDLLPSGIDICGTYGNKLKTADIHFNLTENKLICNVEYDVLSPSQATQKFLLNTEFRLKGKLIFNVKCENGKLINFVAQPCANAYAYYFKEYNLILTSDTVDQLPSEIFDRKSASSVDVNLIKSMKAENSNVPTIKCEKQDITSYEFQTSVDILCYANQYTTAKELFYTLDEGLKRYLNSLFSCFENFMTKNEEIGIPGAHHFKLPKWPHPVTIVYPRNLSDDDLLSYRKDVLHPRFLEPTTQPIFRKQNSINFRENRNKLILNNVHIGLKDPTMIDGKNHLVQGTYSYHHYMQDNINDNGWGCAYRSLQTIISWFTHQGYTSKPMPTHHEIQQILVNVGDKPKEFVGTRKWIGSIEVSNVLNEYLGVTSKIMFVSQGSELVSRGRELSMHFEKQGTPVMIGGGVLAHTILGVRFSETSGETRFLILDPHYTGSVNLATIQDKGWCGWKAPSFWNQTAYYNLCLPQTPHVF